MKKRIMSMTMAAIILLMSTACSSSETVDNPTDSFEESSFTASERENTSEPPIFTSEDLSDNTTVTAEKISEDTISMTEKTPEYTSANSATEKAPAETVFATAKPPMETTVVTVSPPKETATVTEKPPKETTVATENSPKETAAAAHNPSENPIFMRDITTFELVGEMGYGINLGNTLEACGNWISGDTPAAYERAWGSPIITKEIIQTYADGGFGVLRIPVAWSNLMERDGTYTISPEYAARVKEVVDWTLETGMYAIVNIHWDNGWVNTFPENKEECMNRFIRMWTQIAELFEDYGDKLMFESQNEELGWESIWNPWSGNDEEKKESYALVNEVNQTFVDTIRSGGGHNPKRHLLISGYNTGIDRSCDPLFKMPDDPAGRMALSVHYYTPSTLCILDSDASWGKAITEWGDEKDLDELEQNMNMLKESYIDKGIPVIVGEYGCFGDNKEREVKEHWMLTVSKAMYDIGACPVLWDTPGGECDRENARFGDPEFIEELIRPWKEAKRD